MRWEGRRQDACEMGFCLDFPPDYKNNIMLKTRLVNINVLFWHKYF
nr:MAG TPA: hypothetical protein [Caudoviricetes sp.]